VCQWENKILESRKKEHRQSPACDGLTYDFFGFSLLQKHNSVETILGILNFNLSSGWQYVVHTLSQ
jgi:hypothetical protein